MAGEKRTRIRESWASRLFDAANYIFLALLGVATLGPFIYVLFGSLTKYEYYRKVGVAFSIANWSLDAYRILLGSKSIIYDAAKVSVLSTTLGTALSLIVTAALAYGLAKKDLPGHKFFTFALLFTMLFDGGMVPYYLLVKTLGLFNSLWALILPGAVTAWNTFLMVRFFDALPHELEDAARIDGCSELGIFWRIVLPLSKPVLATVGLFYAVARWNQWFWPSLFITTKTELRPLQLVLHILLTQAYLPITDVEAAIELSRNPPPTEVLRMAAIIVSILPIVVVYPSLQKYFVKGVTVGSVKG